jgi:type II secretion system protein N
MSPLPLLQSVLGSLRSLRPLWAANSEVDVFGRLGRLGGRLPVLSSRTSWLLYTLTCFVFFVVLTFPSGVLLQRLVASVPRDSGVRARYVEGDCTWLEGCVLRDLTLESPLFGGSAVQLSRLTLHPSWWGLVFGGQPWPLGFNADGYNGTFSGTMRQVVGGMSGQLALRHLALDQLPLPAPWGLGRIAGSMIADGDFLGNPADLYSLQGALTVTLSDGMLRGGVINGFPLPALQTVQVHLRASLAAGRLEISELRLAADGVEAALQGGITLRTPVARSGLDLQLTTNITGSPPPAVKTLLSLLPASSTAAGERRASITGSLAAPVAR